MIPSIFRSCSRAIVSQLNVKMLLLTLLPFFLSVLIWGVVLWFSLQPMIDWIQDYFIEHDGFRVAGNTLTWLGLGALKLLIVPLLAMWTLLPLMIVTAIIFVGALGMPTIINYLARRYYPQLEVRNGGSVLCSIWVAATTFVVFIFMWLVTLPISFVPPFGLLIPPMLWGWLTYRVIAYDALSKHADDIERKALLRLHRWPLLAIGTLTGLLGAAPTLLWLSGALQVILFPFFAAASIWLYVLIFTFTGLWFGHYCLGALERYRATVSSLNPAQIISE